MTTGQRDHHVRVRVTNDGAKWITGTAERVKVSKSELVRQALAFAASSQDLFEDYAIKRTREGKTNG